MTEEIPLEDPEKYKFPEGYFRRLEKYYTNGARYSIVQGNLARRIREETDAEPEAAMDVSAILNRGDIDEARKKVEELLEQ